MATSDSFFKISSCSWLPVCYQIACSHSVNTQSRDMKAKDQEVKSAPTPVNFQWCTVL